MLRVVEVLFLLGRSLDWLRSDNAVVGPGLRKAMAEAEAAIELWRSGPIDAAGLRHSLVRASVHLPLARNLYCDLFASDAEVIRGATLIGRLREFGKAFVAFAEAYETFLASKSKRVSRVRVSVVNDRLGAVLAGLRAAMALVIVSTFWILADWPSGAVAAILAAVVTARLATMEHAVLAATGGTLAIVLGTFPSFIVVEILLPHASGFAMFAVTVAPMLFLCAYLMAHEKTAGIGFVAGLYFANTAGFQDRMAYDPVGFLNASIALALALATAAVLFAIIAPDTPRSARHRFARVARKAVERIVRRRPRIGLADFEVSMTEALDQLRRVLRLDKSEDVAAVEAGIALMGVGRELIRVRDAGRPAMPPAIKLESELLRFLASNRVVRFDCARHAANEAVEACLAELRDDNLGVADTRAAAREMVAFAAIRDELGRCGGLVQGETMKGGRRHAA